jgi:hypothetical protein
MNVMHTADIDPTWFIRPDGHDGSHTIHGVAHTARVHTHATEIAEALDLHEWEREALHYAALWHDIGRTGDGVDPTHGALSAAKVCELDLDEGVRPRIVRLAIFAVTYHSTHDDYAHAAVEGAEDAEACLRVFNVLKDADGLDRVRLGDGDLDPSFLRFPVSKTRIDRAWELLHQVR